MGLTTQKALQDITNSVLFDNIELKFVIIYAIFTRLGSLRIPNIPQNAMFRGSGFWESLARGGLTDLQAF